MTPLEQHMQGILTTPERSVRNLAPPPSDLGIPPELDIPTPDASAPTRYFTSGSDPQTTEIPPQLIQYLQSGQVLSPAMFDQYGGSKIMEMIRQTDPGAYWEDVNTGAGTEGGGGVIGKRLAHDPFYDQRQVANAKYPLQNFMRMQQSGWNVLPEEYYRHFGGDEILSAVKKYDPNATWTPSALSGGEAGPAGYGQQLQYDQAKVPSGFGLSFADPSNPSGVYNPKLIREDPLFGYVTPSWNVKKHNDPTWVKLAPLVVAGAATLGAGLPALGGLTAAEAGAGGAASVGSAAADAAAWAGTTPAVTGGAAGLAAGNIATQAPPWWATLGAKALPGVGRTVTGFTASPPAFDPAAYNNAGSAKKAAGANDSALVATQFADDPYRFSG